MNRLAKAAVVVLSVIVFLYVGLGYVLGKTTDDNKAYRSLTVYGEVLQHIQEDYVDEPNMSLVTAGALHGLLESLDPLSGYLSPKEYADYRMREKSGPRAETGVTLSKRFGYIIVVSVLPYGPAEHAGLRSGDLLESIGGFSTRDMSVAQATMLLEGTPGSTAQVAAIRRGSSAPQPISITRQAIPQQHVVADRVTEDTAYIRLPVLDAGVTSELRNKLVQFDQKGVHKLILDLRDCSSGPDAEGIAAAKLFLSAGKITVLQGQTVPRQESDAAPDKVVWRAPMEVLTSPSTSGAAEILAAAIGGDKRGDVVGERTFGSASQQKVIPLDDGGALVLTDAFYYTPDGKSIVDNGVAPTVEVRLAPLDDVAGEDAEPPPPLAPGQLPHMDDPVLNKALQLLNSSSSQRKAA